MDDGSESLRLATAEDVAMLDASIPGLIGNTDLDDTPAIPDMPTSEEAAAKYMALTQEGRRAWRSE